MKSSWNLLESNLAKITSNIASTDRIDPSGGSDEKLIALAKELDDLVAHLQRLGRDPNTKGGQPDDHKVGQAWKTLLTTLRGTR